MVASHVLNQVLKRIRRWGKQKSQHIFTKNRKERLALIYSFFPSLFGLTSLEALSMMGEVLTDFSVRLSRLIFKVVGRYLVQNFCPFFF